MTFSPSTGGQVERYTLRTSGPGKSVPESVAADGPFQFEFGGGDCAREYTFVVVAHWAGGEVESEPSAGAKPCVAPGSPTGFTAKARNRGADLSWSAPENAADGTTYELTGAVTRSGVQGTSLTVDGLKNDQKHTFTLKAKNAAGESPDVATTTVDLAYPRKVYKNAHNDQTNTRINSCPTGNCQIGTIPKGEYRDLTVICQVKGMSVTETQSGETSVVWDRIEWNGGVAYISDTLMTTPRGGFPAPPLFECTD
ncbi:fibronectin type III domain-containing protein [Nonomuraea aridisoli]|uniref:Fibronectin type-III domain-containing protein n=1 Tax=Nonomuraea aridisoli TaxID=2070368 RepID=A0A2W2CRT5_9ACTN|nr:fibronectin type III domain-containing protein [Nonomuraea aridisoli]PZG02236.1 hypothetical protein C1J01_47495 [Nonomuraea aridisoli]